MSKPEKIKLQIVHPNARNVEAFLNSWTEPFEWIDIPDHPYMFRSAVSRTQVEILFFDSQGEGFAYGKEHFGTSREKQRWSMNGSFLYAVSGSDKDLIDDLAGHFAGRE